MEASKAVDVQNVCILIVHGVVDVVSDRVLVVLVLVLVVMQGGTKQDLNGTTVAKAQPPIKPPMNVPEIKSM